MKCNIDAKGKAVRLVMGLLTLTAAIALAVLILVLELSAGLWFAVAGAGIGGGFAIFEARAGWCVVRAMGLKTPI